MITIMRFKRSAKNIMFGALIGLILLVLLAFAVSKLRWLLTEFIVPTHRPAQIINSNEPVATEIFFSNEGGRENPSQTIIKEIDKAQKTLEIAMYSFKSVAIREAIYRANLRGVKVTLILDWHKRAEHDIFLSDWPIGIRRLDLGGASNVGGTALMHHKFALIDRDRPNQKLIFGSFNWTQLQEEYDRSFFLVTGNAELVKSFGREFDRLTSGTSGPQKLKNKNYHPWDLTLTAAGYNYEVWFGPGRAGENIDYRILELLREAKKEIKIMVWDFTDQALAEEIVRRAQAGLKIIIIADNLNFYNKNSVFNYLLSAKAELNLTNLEILINNVVNDKKGETVDPFLHYHLLIIDEQKILFGTNNWSQGGSFFNDESALVTDDPQILINFKKSFQYNYQQGRVAPAPVRY